MPPDNIGKRLKRLREMRELTIRALAIQAGVPQSTISQVEAGHRHGAGLRLDTAKRLSWALGVGLEALAGPYHEEDFPVPNAPVPPAQPTKRPRTRKAVTAPADEVLSLEAGYHAMAEENRQMAEEAMAVATEVLS